MSNRLVFVGGLHRSGTTALVRTLAQHPDVSGFANTGAKEDEGQHLQTVYPPARTYGGAGRFAADPASHLTEDSPLATRESADTLMEEWGRHWDLSKPVLVEKSPPNLVMTRFLQALFPECSHLVVVRHPAVVALSTARWRRWSGLPALIENWLVAHELFVADAQHLNHVHVIRYEHLIARPRAELATAASFLGLSGAIPPDLLQTGRSEVYMDLWNKKLARSGPARGLRQMVDRLGPRVSALGYDLEDITAVGAFPSVGKRPHAHES